MARLDDSLVLEVKRRSDLLGVVRRHVKLKPVGREFSGLCPFHQEKSASFTVAPRKSFFHCFGCGAHGDAIGFTMRISGLDFVGAVRLLAQDLGIVVDGPAARIDPEVARARAAERAQQEAERRAKDRAEREQDIQWCRDVWGRAKECPPDLALRYLNARGLALRALPASIRCQPSMAHRESGRSMPCMIGAIQNLDGEIVGIHRTFLNQDGTSKAPVKPAKKMNGQAWGGAVRLSMPPPLVNPAGGPQGQRHDGTLAIGEGIETTLSVMLALDGETPWPGHVTFWAGLSLGNLAGGGQGFGGYHPARVMKNGKRSTLPSTRPDPDRPGIVLPGWARRVVLLADADAGDPPSAEALLQCAANRFRAQRRTVLIARPPGGTDFNDALVEDAA